MHRYTPFIRYFLLLLAGWLAHGGWLPAHIGDEIANDPAVIELATSALIGLGTLIWYVWSRSRAALVEALK